MRIISGSKRGHKLFEFEGQGIRPTTDRVKESMFNLIQDFVPGSRVLDLFGGSGALSFEALSRGSEQAVCVDIDKDSIAVIKKNAMATGLLGIEIVNRDAMSYISSADEKFSLIFLDPPYNRGMIAPIINAIVEKDVLEEEGIIVLESDFCDEHGEFFGLSILKQRKYGRSYVTIYKKG